MAIMDLGRDPTNPRARLDRPGYLSALMRHVANHSEAGAAGAADGGDKEGSTQTSADDGGSSYDGGPVDPDKFREVLDDRARKGRKVQQLSEENRSMKERLDKLEADQREREEADLSAKDLAEKRAREAEEQLAVERATSAKKDRLLVVSRAGVGAFYQETVETLLSQAQNADPNLDVSAWMKDLATKQPALFGNGSSSETPPPAPPSGGPPAQKKSPTLAALQQELETCKDPERAAFLRRGIRKEEARQKGV